MLNFVLCDDNQVILDRLCKMLESIFIKHNFDAEIIFSSTVPENILDFIKENNNVHVLFLDIDLKSKMSGLDLASQIRKVNKQVLIAYQYKTFDFIPKPITIERLEETFLRIIDDIETDYSVNNFIRIDNRNTIINEDSIYFIKKNGMKLVFYTDNRIYETYSSFSKIEEILPSNFVRCHKSYIANINKIHDISLNNNSISFDSTSNMKCYIGPKYKNKMMEVLKYDKNFTDNLE